MKTSKSAKSTTTAAPVQAPAQVAPTPTVTPTPERAALPPLDFAKRREYREFPTDRVLDLLRAEEPRFFEIAEVVGKWVWIQFPEKQTRDVTAALSQFGFHWNSKRQAWQHPCGQFTTGSTADPRTKYGTHFAADQVPA